MHTNRVWVRRALLDSCPTGPLQPCYDIGYIVHQEASQKLVSFVVVLYRFIFTVVR